MNKREAAELLFQAADCPLRTAPTEWDYDLGGEYDEDYANYVDDEPFEGCCEAADVNGINASGWGECMHCGEPVNVLGAWGDLEHAEDGVGITDDPDTDYVHESAQERYDNEQREGNAI